LMRLFDDLKDVAADQQLFPERPVPRGLVSPRDLWRMVLGVHVLLLTINLLIPLAFPWLLVALAFTWLTFKWFFARPFISTRLIVAFITHQPVGFLLNIWVASALISGTSVTLHDNRVLFLCFLFITPVMLWEISRKIKAQGTENEYVTYSKILGPQLAAYLLLMVASILSGGLIWAGDTLGVLPLHIYLQGILFLGFAIVVFRFLLNPIRKNLILKEASILLAMCALVTYLICLIISFPPQFAWL
jgi:4-hydroxybenzoate polyprenyltransferase